MLRQVHSQKQHLHVLPQQIQLLKLFHLNTLELGQRIQQELNENPLLEEEVAEEKASEDVVNDEVKDYQDEEEYSYDDIPDYKTEYNNYLSEENTPQRPISDRYDFRKDLKEQIQLILKNEREVILTEYLIDSLNDEGMLEQDDASLADDISFNKQIIVEAFEIEKMRNVLKQLEPYGIGCISIKEFLLLQLHRMDQSDKLVSKAIHLLESHFTDLSNRNLDKIAHNLQLEDHELRDILELISSCKMKPLTESSSSYGVNNTVIPDFIVRYEDDGYEVNLYHQRSSTLFINQSFTKKLNEQKQTDKGAFQYLKSKLNSAQWFVSAIQQRETTMLTVMNVIIDLQKEYFKEGDIRLLKPMILKNVADIAGVDISTVSRITCNKYADTHFGTILLKDLFSEGIENKEGEVISNRVIQTAIEEVVQAEDKKNPYTDQQLVSLLSTKGFTIARRTVAKYREQLQIPVAQMRALWAQ